MKWLLLFFFAGCIHVGASTIFVVGDSHVREFQGIPNVSLYHLGPFTMHRLGRDQLNALNVKKLGVSEGDCVVFVFGEIDVRCHIGKQRDLKGRSVKEIMEKLVFNYVKAILDNRSLFHRLTCIVYNITPPTDTVYNAEYPRYGSLEERAGLTKQMNHLLKSICTQYGIPFLDIYEDFADERGALITELGDENVHINYKYNQPIQQKLYELLNSCF